MSNRSTGNAEHVSYLFLGDLCSTSWSFETNLMCLLMTMRRHIKSIKAPRLFVFFDSRPHHQRAHHIRVHGCAAGEGSGPDHQGEEVQAQGQAGTFRVVQVPMSLGARRHVPSSKGPDIGGGHMPPNRHRRRAHAAIRVKEKPKGGSRHRRRVQT